MSQVAADPVALAQHLAGRRQGRTAGTGLTAEHPGLDLELAYDVQEAGVRLLAAAGERQVGFKLGLTSRAKQAQMGVGEPLYGELTDAMVLDVGEPLDTGTEEIEQAAGGAVRTAAFAPTGSDEIARLAVEALQDRRAALMARHGALGVGRSPAEALRITQVLERQAQLALLLRGT